MSYFNYLSFFAIRLKNGLGSVAKVGSDYSVLIKLVCSVFCSFGLKRILPKPCIKFGVLGGSFETEDLKFLVLLTCYSSFSISLLISSLILYKLLSTGNSKSFLRSTMSSKALLFLTLSFSGGNPSG